MKTEMKVPNECLYPTDVFLITCGMGCKRITVSDIAYIEAMKDNCIIHMVDGKRYTQSCPMGDIEPELNPQMFMRIHRSFIVNIRYIDMYYYGHVVLENGMASQPYSLCHDCSADLVGMARMPYPPTICKDYLSSKLRSASSTFSKWNSLSVLFISSAIWSLHRFPIEPS